MTTTATETGTRTCACGKTITPHERPGNAWRDERGDLWCEDGKLHAPACPPSSVVDLIVTWPDVQEGDLVLWDGELRLLTRLIDYDGDPLMWFDGSKFGPGVLPCGTYAAVKRYQTGEGR
jgi:hypothetical protein